MEVTLSAPLVITQRYSATEEASARRVSVGDCAPVMVALLRAIQAAGRQTSDRARRRTLSRHANLITTLVRDTVSYSDDADPVTTIANTIIAELDSA